MGIKHQQQAITVHDCEYYAISYYWLPDFNQSKDTGCYLLLGGEVLNIFHDTDYNQCVGVSEVNRLSNRKQQWAGGKVPLKAYLQQFAFPRVRKGRKHFFVLLHSELRDRRTNIRTMARVTLACGGTRIQCNGWLTFAFSMSTQKWQSAALKKWSLALYFRSVLSIAWVPTWKSQNDVFVL